MHCINCGIAIPRSQKFQYNATEMDVEIISVLEEWVARQVNDQDYLCHECASLLIVESTNRSEGNKGERRLGHKSVCVNCGISVAIRTGRRVHQIGYGDAVWIYFSNMMYPLCMPENALACNACWQRAHRQRPPVAVLEPSNEDYLQTVAPINRSNTVMEPPSVASQITFTEAFENFLQEPALTFTLNGYKRTPDMTTRCFVTDCVNQGEGNYAPMCLRKNILAHKNLFITRNARACEEHLSLDKWDILTDYEFLKEFNQDHVTEMLDLLKWNPNNAVDLEKVEKKSNGLPRRSRRHDKSHDVDGSA